MSGRELLKGHYFPYCEWCENDGKCELLHCEFLGMESGGKVDDSPYTSHEDVSWGISGFQRGLKRGTCTGRIYGTDSIYYPLACECGTVLSSLQFSAVLGTGFCAKFRPNEGGKARMKMAEKIVEERGIDLSEIDPEELLPEQDPCYRAAMMY